MPQAAIDIREALEWLDTISLEAAERFANRLREEITTLRQRLAVEISESENHRMMLAPDDAASTYFSRPVYRHVFRTGKSRQRRNSAGLWYLFFAVTDDDGDEIPDMLRVYSVRHSARRPLDIGGTEITTEHTE